MPVSREKQRAQFAWVEPIMLQVGLQALGHALSATKELIPQMPHHFVQLAHKARYQLLSGHLAATTVSQENIVQQWG